MMLYGKFKEIWLHIKSRCTAREFRWQVSASIVDLEDAFLPQIWGIAGRVVCLSESVELKATGVRSSPVSLLFRHMLKALQVGRISSTELHC